LFTETSSTETSSSEIMNLPPSAAMAGTTLGLCRPYFIG
jgi:hypothetical protein